MALLKRRSVDTGIENKILTGMIISDALCRDMSRLVNKNTFLLPFAYRISMWCSDYYEKYKQAPRGYISDLFLSESDSLPEEDRIVISSFLAKISSQYEEQGINEEYLKDMALEYIKQRHLTVSVDKAKTLLEAGRVEEAENVLQSFKQSSIMTAKWENPLSIEAIIRYFSDEMSQKSVIFTLPGDHGVLMGPICRNSLLGFLAPTKRGKSFWLMELAIHGAFSRKKVVLISLEMDSHMMRGRMYKRLGGGFPTSSKEYLFPCFDCKKNQAGSCNKIIRTNSSILLDEAGKKPNFSKENPYRPCTACKGGAKGNFGYEVATWFTVENVSKTKSSDIVKKIEYQFQHFGNDMKMIAYPSFSANLKRVQSDLTAIEESEGFVPDLIVIDYADILAPEDSKVVGRDRIDETWKTLKYLADNKHCSVISASQANRASFKKKNVEQTDASEDIRKIANSDKFYAVNQTPQEKKEGVSRIAKIAARNEPFDPFENAIILQQMDLGQFVIDSYLYRASELLYEVGEDFSV